MIYWKPQWISNLMIHWVCMLYIYTGWPSFAKFWWRNFLPASFAPLLVLYFILILILNYYYLLKKNLGPLKAYVASKYRESKPQLSLLWKAYVICSWRTKCLIFVQFCNSLVESSSLYIFLLWVMYVMKIFRMYLKLIWNMWCVRVININPTRFLKINMLSKLNTTHCH